MNGVKFGDKHSYDDFGLLLAARPDIGAPTPKTNYVTVAGADGVLDLSEVLTGHINYNTRKISMTFVLMDERMRWDNIYSDLLAHLHGKKMNVTFDSDPTYYYEGRFTVDKWKSNKKSATITITGEAQPYKVEFDDGSTEWLWDTFNFETDYIKSYNEIPVNGSTTVTIIGMEKPSRPTIISNASMTMTYNGDVYPIEAGTQEIDVYLADGVNALTFTGSGTISIRYKGGRL